MDLGTIKARLMNGYYSSMYDVMYDINAIWTACFSFNSPDKEVYKCAVTLKEMYENQLEEIYEESGCNLKN
ncbi:uncharacterized protein [Blastocystis hominis]|uniref:Bromo domain-containing protein n=1 Tax=Blastocystis hominis TaxID=12968 RepID=D8M6C6_BLAHO|nr:uncharacterized protein [Blastocystis hominis]CBK23679.2 unnamed protein product [Blastocystis hominis]|eukprot:XP_012897727.1 uncharacterized protein [Blastocystis hominis]